MKIRVLFTVILAFFFLTGIASATTIDLDALYDNEGDGIIHFGDQYIASFSDPGCDYTNYTSVSQYFILTDSFDSSQSFGVTITHYNASLDLGYENYFSINGYNFGILSDSNSGWLTEIFTASNTHLILGTNEVVFYIDSDGSNQDDFEIKDFALTYESTGIPPTVPEPATILLLGFGVLGLAGVRRSFSK